MEIQVAAAQVRSVQADPESNFEIMEEVCKRPEISSSDQPLLVFPEMCVTGYLMHDDIFSLAEPVPEGGYCERLAELANNYDCYIIAGMPEEPLPGLIYNTAVCFGPKGYLGKSRKILLPNHSVFNEKRYYREATEIGVIDTPLGRIGMQICYDIFSPEITRAHAFLGAHTSICISASPGVRRKYFETFLPARAMENTINLVYVNQSGIQDDLIFWGGSEIRTATGQQILKLKYDEPDFGIVPLDTEATRGARPFVPTLRNVPPWIYKSLEKGSRRL
ncbi:MAG: carbon-nitrogen hydrolase family protein [Candidatus Heimdallarchaeota archaeon]